MESPSAVDSITFDWISTKLLLTLETAVNTPLTPMSIESLNTKAAIMKPLQEKKYEKIIQQEFSTLFQVVYKHCFTSVLLVTVCCPVSNQY